MTYLTTNFLTVAEVAHKFGVSKMTVYRLIHAGDLTAVRVGGSYRIPEMAVGQYIATHTTGSAS